MGIVLNRGDEANLTKEDPALKKVCVGLGWDIKERESEFGLSSDDGHVAYDLDASAFLLTEDKKIRSERDFIFYNNQESESKAVVHKGDNTTGKGDGDDEIIEIDLSNVPYDIKRIAFSVSIHNAKDRRHHFGMIENAFIRVWSEDTGVELARYNLTEKFDEETGVLFGELYRIGSEWVFIAIGEGNVDGLAGIAKSFDVNVIDYE